jgi:hypothetical protein
MRASLLVDPETGKMSGKSYNVGLIEPRRRFSEETGQGQVEYPEVNNPGSVVEIRRQPFLRLGYRLRFAQGVVFELIFGQLADGEVF